MLLLLRYLFALLRSLLFMRPANVTKGSLGALVQVSVLSGARPALEVVHDWDGIWTVSDGVCDLDEPGESVSTHLSRAALWDSSITGLVSMEPGRIARRADPSKPWVVSTLAI